MAPLQQNCRRESIWRPPQVKSGSVRDKKALPEREEQANVQILDAWSTANAFRRGGGRRDDTFPTPSTGGRAVRGSLIFRRMGLSALDGTQDQYRVLMGLKTSPSEVTIVDQLGAGGIAWWSALGQKQTSAPTNDYVSSEPVSGRLSGARR
jgi:hypothetical protein